MTITDGDRETPADELHDRAIACAVALEGTGQRSRAKVVRALWAEIVRLRMKAPQWCFDCHRDVRIGKHGYAVCYFGG